MKPAKKTEQKFDTLQKSIEGLKQKLKLLNFNNLQPPFFPHTLTKYRQNYLSPYLKNIDLERCQNSKKIIDGLKTVHYIFQNFDDECFESYAQQLKQPYTRKMFQDNYEFDEVNFREANLQYHLKNEIQETLAQASEWLVQIQITQDLLSRVQLYFKIQTPHIIERVRQDGLKSEKNTWVGSIASGFRKILSFSLRKGSKTVQSTFFTALAPTALMLTFAIIGGTASLPWKTDLTLNSLLPAFAVITVPYLLDGMAQTVEKSQLSATLKRWSLGFEALGDNVRKFNEILEEAMRNCTLSGNVEQFLKEKTNLQKIIDCLKKDASSLANFNEEKIQQMRERTEAYFKPYIEIEQDDWTIVYPKEEQQSYRDSK